MPNPIRARPDRSAGMRWVFGRTLAAIVLLGSLVGCGTSTSTENQRAVDVGAATGATHVPELLQFTAPLVGGGDFADADYAGRATAFWFWAPT